jgi:Rieske Fe-S protein
VIKPAHRPGGIPLERRTFLTWATHGLGAFFAVVLGIPAVAYLVDPLKRHAGQRGFRKVARLSELAPDVPTQVVIKDIRHDAWTLHPDDIVGRVWLVRRKDNKVDAFTTICPHLGCSVNFVKESQLFICPCHNGTFELSGELKKDTVAQNPPPRGMDSLEIQLTEDPDPAQLVDDPSNPGQKKRDQVVEVKYENFIQGRHDKVAKA